MELSIVLPCYNESRSLPAIAGKFAKILKTGLKVEMIMVDNGSSDDSNKIIRSLIRKNENIRLAEVRKNIGYGNGIWKGIQEARGEYICWSHADLQTDIFDAVKALEIAQKDTQPEKCFVKGKRKGRSLFDLFFTFGMSAVETLYLGTVMTDINSQPNLFHRSFLNEIKNPPKDFSFDLYFYYMAKKNGLKIKRFPVFFGKRLYGQSHWNIGFRQKWKFIKRTVDYSARLKSELKTRE